MCGIFLVMSAQQPVDPVRFDQARDTMIHRGPDAAGSVFFENNRVALGHRRLAILDLSQAANQPMQLDSICVTYNGEIYNYPELRKELEDEGCRFRTHSDTEVLLHGYKVWGRNLCEHLSGMFAFAIWDDTEKLLFIGRDHIGQKPLYYFQAGKYFVAASEIKAIRSFLGRHFQLRPESLLDTLLYDFVPEPYTWYRGVECVLPGHSMVVKRHGGSFSAELREYWTFRPDPDPAPISPIEGLEVLGHEIEKAVKSHLLADVEVGAFLSGGADSSCIVALASEYIDHPIKTFSIGFGLSDDELPLARQTAQSVGAVHKEGIVTAADFRGCLDSVLNTFDQPFADSSLVPTERVAALASKDVKVVLTGDGGDEVFGGYNLGWYVSPMLELRLAQRMNLSWSGATFLAKHLYSVVRYLAFGATWWQTQDNFQPYRRSQRNELLKWLGDDLAVTLHDYDPRWAFAKYRDMTVDPFRRAQWLHTKTILPGKMLVKVDRCSMQHSLEARSPFLSHRLVEAMLNMPTQVRNPTDDWYKGLFRTWVRDKVPISVLSARKRGFGVPTQLFPDPRSHSVKDSLRRCVDASLVKASALEEISRKPRLYWKLLQVERALEEGLLGSNTPADEL